ncbi:hypothetical protein [Streptomyces avermitilis]|uniref:hypothetical protein n=1 Tax=Streptomyces avermitilis TaxID=33903 RepID=UPI0037136A14
MTAPRVCCYRANRGELLLLPETGQPVLGQWDPIVTPAQRRCSISGPLADEALERLLFPQAQGQVWLPESMRQRWRSGEMGLEEKRKIIASVFTCCIVRRGVKGEHSWDHSRVEPV